MFYKSKAEISFVNKINQCLDKVTFADKSKTEIAYVNKSNQYLDKVTFIYKSKAEVAFVNKSNQCVNKVTFVNKSYFCQDKLKTISWQYSVDFTVRDY